MAKKKGKKRNAAKKRSDNVDPSKVPDSSIHAVEQPSSSIDVPEDDQLSSAACALHISERDTAGKKKRNVAHREVPSPCVPVVERPSSSINVSEDDELSSEACALQFTERKAAVKKKRNVKQPKVPGPCDATVEQSSGSINIPESDETCALPISEEVTKETDPLETVSSESESEAPLDLDLPRKPTEPGKLGRLIKLISNCFPLEFRGINVYHYDVEIISIGSNYTTEDNNGASLNGGKEKKYRCLNTKLNREVFRTMQRDHVDFRNTVFDGKKNLYSVLSLGIKNLEEYEISLDSEVPGDVNDPRGPRKDLFMVKINPVEKETGDNIISLEPLHALFKGKVASVPREAFMVLETVLRHTPCLRYVPVGRCFYYPPNENYTLGGGKEIWFGYHQSVLLGQKQAMVNLDISSTAFYENISVIDYVAQFLNKSVQGLHYISSLTESDIDNLSIDLSNVRVQVTHLHYPREYVIKEVSPKSANDITFTTTKNSKTRETNIKNYFYQEYGIRLQFPHLPCLLVKANKEVCLPFEVCTIVEKQHCNRELNGRQLAEMIKVTAIPPRERYRETLKIYEHSDYRNDQFLRAFDLRVQPDPLKVVGRIINAPQVQYSNEIVRPYNGSWNMKNIKFFSGTKINTWTLLSFADPTDCPKGLLHKFAESLCYYANSQGTELDRCSHIEIANAELQNVYIQFREMKDQFNAELIFVVLPLEADRSRHKSSQSRQKREVNSSILYSEIKKVAETNIGLITQCIKGKNVIEKYNNASFISNLCLKLNAKMGGINNTLMPGEISEFIKDSILIVGADVNHSRDENSIAAVVGSMDENYYRYAVSVSFQKNEKKKKKTCEVIRDMKNMIHKILLEFQKVRKSLPQKIIVYRDGVSEGQFQDVQNREIKWITEACLSIKRDYKPKITFIVVQKGHHRKFLPENQTQGAGPMRNCPPGTAVDSVVTHPLNYDFYLYSHLGLKGTSKCCYYTVLHDDNGYGFDALEKLSYYLCHIYIRCTKSISVPSPIQYAHLAAYRARRHLASHLKDLGEKGLLKGKDWKSKMDSVSIEEFNKAITVKDDMKDTMYFT
ncbi:protein argonaute-2 [Trichonephila inaurata madagascariensis]|uniref:Protein argonaute-2 n=1 Tax=Trichonephila inaurata madagascariensis TaxID=2747483 RepID=A0A8X6WU66_9ARAC|nr:protein argonaute-2 [Trichonephila inaurata madagascariensis]